MLCCGHDDTSFYKTQLIEKGKTLVSGLAKTWALTVKHFTAVIIDLASPANMSQVMIEATI
jgi:hypothetical protein